MLQILDIFFVILHTGIILFNLFGWIWKKTRIANLVLLVLTGFSWSILGIFYGFGYCPFTDLHWDVLGKMGKTGLPSSYVEYLLARLLKIDVSAETADALTGITYLVALIISIVLNIGTTVREKGYENFQNDLCNLCPAHFYIFFYSFYSYLFFYFSFC